MQWRPLKTLGTAVAALLMVALAAAAIYVWRTLPALDGELRAPGLMAPVQIRRDDADVTHIEAQSVRDAMFALGWVHAQERGWQLEFNRRVMAGELSELFGEATLDTDRLIRTLGIMRSARAQYAGLPAEQRAWLDAYADGINAFHAHGGQALSPEFLVLGAEPGPWRGEHAVGWALMMALDLGGNWGTEFARLSLLRTLDTERLWQLLPPYPGEAPATAVDLAALYRGLGVYRSTPVATKTGALEPDSTRSGSPSHAGAWARWSQQYLAALGEVDGKGSNNWVVAGGRTRSGKPLLANDPHLGLNAPAIWYFVRLKAPAPPGGRPLDVIGATLPGLPSVVLGRTAGVAWGFTNTGPDVQDLYLEQIDADDPAHYRTPDGRARFDTREEIIRVKGRPEVRHTVRSTRHGPVLSDAQASHAEVLDTRRWVLALRWSALDADNRTVLAGARANFAQTVDELFAAFADYHSPMQSVVAADTTGRTGFRAIGRLPLRGPAHDLRGVAPAPGWDARYDWIGTLPAEQNPTESHEQIAARGWRATANARITPAGYPHFVTSDWTTPERQERIDTLLAARQRHDPESMREIQADIVSPAVLRLLPVARQAAASAAHPQARAVAALLAEFDGAMRADAAAPLVMAVWADEVTRGLIAPRVGTATFAATYGKRSYRAGVEGMLLEPDVGAWWCAPHSCGQQAAAAMDRALARIVAEQGDDATRWQWGRAHPALSSHRPFGNVAALARFFDVRVPSDGDTWTINVGQYWPNQKDRPFANRHAASLRAVYDLAEPERSRFIYQTGQSGLVWSPRYRDMARPWATVEYRPLRLNPPHWRHPQTLTP